MSSLAKLRTESTRCHGEDPRLNDTPDAWDRARDETNRARQRLDAGVSNPKRFFATRGFGLRCYKDGSEWWCDLGRRRDWRRRPLNWARRYGRGPTKEASRESAVRRWLIEQEPPDLERRPGDRLP